MDLVHRAVRQNVAVSRLLPIREDARRFLVRREDGDARQSTNRLQQDVSLAVHLVHLPDSGQVTSVERITKVPLVVSPQVGENTSSFFVLISGSNFSKMTRFTFLTGGGTRSDGFVSRAVSGKLHDFGAQALKGG